MQHFYSQDQDVFYTNQMEKLIQSQKNKMLFNPKIWQYIGSKGFILNSVSDVILHCPRILAQLIAVGYFFRIK